LSVEEYAQLLEQGWRRFGHSLFRPRCPFCTACWSLRVLVDQYTMNRSQKRNQRANQARVRLEIGEPLVDEKRLALHDAFHSHQAAEIGWPKYPPKDVSSYITSFVNNPIPTEEWRYYSEDKLIGVGYVDVVPSGLSAIYYFHDPAYRDWGLGTWNVINVIQQSRQRNMPYAYLGYYVSGCRSIEYKACFTPYEAHDPVTGIWRLTMVDD
ncbi:MAG TPA: arginyltransferase, partial [Gemmatales bacterium]|nr:arginyltransferase [Gemmatales bacterium]